MFLGIPRSVWLLALVCLGVNLAIFAGIAVRRPEYLRDYRLCNNPDAPHYVTLGRNVLLTGNYSRCDGPPYPPDMLRPPVYPLFAGGLDLLADASAVYLAHGLLQAGSCLLLFLLVRPVFGARAGFWASVLLATDLMLAVFNFQTMSEPLFVFLILAALACLLPALTSGGAARLLGGGLLLGLAILTRPAALYVLPLLAIALIGVGAWRRRPLPALAGVGALLVGALLTVAPWVIRNQLVFGVPRVSTVDSGVQVYFFGAGAYQLRHHLTLEDAQAQIAEEFSLEPYVVTQNPWRSERTVAELDGELRQASPKVLRQYPRELLLSSLLGVGKASVSHNADELASLLGSRWDAPGTGDLLHGRADAFRRLAENGPLLAGVFGWQLLHAVAALALAAAGVLFALRRPDTWPAAGVLLVLLAYSYLTVALFGYEAFYRARIPVLPFQYTFAGWGLSCLLARRSATPRAA
jgi:4-amino-4-deoxy-L-arabinose transferase-like glycosyltransferase